MCKAGSAQACGASAAAYDPPVCTHGQPHLCSPQMLHALRCVPAPAEGRQAATWGEQLAQHRGKALERHAATGMVVCTVHLEAVRRAAPQQPGEAHLAVDAVAAGGGDGADLVGGVCRQGHSSRAVGKSASLKPQGPPRQHTMQAVPLPRRPRALPSQGNPVPCPTLTPCPLPQH